MGHGELLINSLETAFVWERPNSSVGSERLISNSSLTSRPAFHLFGDNGRTWHFPKLFRNYAATIRCFNQLTKGLTARCSRELCYTRSEERRVGKECISGVWT